MDIFFNVALKKIINQLLKVYFYIPNGEKLHFDLYNFD